MRFFTYRTLSLKVSLLLAMATMTVWAFNDNPPPARTGFFGEPSCAECHSDYEVDSGRALGGDFSILGVPYQYVPGADYIITVQISHPGQQRWGFELATRFMDGSQAGTITLLEPDTTVFEDFDDVRYIKQTGLGSYAGVLDGPIPWSFLWTAPEAGAVVFGAAGNAADFNGFADGDYIYLAQQITTSINNCCNAPEY